MRRLTALLLILLVSFPLLAVSAGTIYFATDDELRSMAELRGLDSEGSREELQNALYEHEGLEAYEETVTEEDSGSGSVSLEILQAENLSSSDGSFVLNGNSSISFTDKDGVVSDLRADTIVIDTNNSHLSALDNVRYHSDSPDASIDDIEADIVSIYWDSGEIKVSNATTSTVKEGADGEESVTIFTSGETLTYSPGGSILYEKGRIGSAAEDPHSSITASTIAMLPGSDMFISNAYLSIGRVPILYLPYFFFPGSRVVGNPSFGFSSSNGAFLNTTFEILGSSEKVQNSGDDSSFMSMLSSGDSAGDLQPYGAYYSASQPLSPMQQWAKDSSSYIAIMADAYANLGVHLGVDGVLNFFDKTLSVSFFNGIAISHASENYGINNFRYYGQNAVSYENFGLSAQLSVPFYSDNRVLQDFGNRLSGFSIMSLLETPSFPEDYTSSISTFSRTLDLSYTLPSEHRNDFVDSFRFTDVTVEADYRWSSSDRKYYMEGATLPEFGMTLSGTLFSLSGTAGQTVRAVEEEEDDVTDIHLLKDPLLYDIYKAQKRAEERALGKEYNISLKYSVTENLSNTYDFDSKGKLTDGDFSSDSALRLTFAADMADYVSLNAVFTPSYSYMVENRHEAAIVTQNTSVNSDVSLSLPFIGLQYSLSTKLLNLKSITEGGVEDVTLLNPGWDRDTVTSHSIGFSKAFETIIGTFTPSITYRLPPLSGSLIPKLSYSYGPFALSFSWTFLEDDDTGDFLSDLIELSAGYNGTYLTSSISLKYQSAEYDSSDFFAPLYGNASLSLRTADKKWSITEYVDYEYRNSGYKHYFNSVSTTFTIPYFDMTLEWAGPAESLAFNSIKAHADVDNVFFQLWKGRLYFGFGLQASFEMDMNNPYAASFEITPSFTFSIAEFLDFKFSFTSSNNGFYDYFRTGSFSVSEFFNDLWQSFDFFGDGRYNTNFVLDECALEITHYMDDWNLNVKYAAEVLLNGDVYEFVPEFSIYLSWKTIPDLKVDQSWKERNGVWQKQ